MSCRFCLSCPSATSKETLLFFPGPLSTQSCVSVCPCCFLKGTTSHRNLFSSSSVLPFSASPMTTGPWRVLQRGEWEIHLLLFLQVSDTQWPFLMYRNSRDNGLQGPAGSASEGCPLHIGICILLLGWAATTQGYCHLQHPAPRRVANRALLAFANRCCFILQLVGLQGKVAASQAFKLTSLCLAPASLAPVKGTYIEINLGILPFSSPSPGISMTGYSQSQLPD